LSAYCRTARGFRYGAAENTSVEVFDPLQASSFFSFPMTPESFLKERESIQMSIRFAPPFPEASFFFLLEPAQLFLERRVFRHRRLFGGSPRSLSSRLFSLFSSLPSRVSEDIGEDARARDFPLAVGLLFLFPFLDRAFEVAQIRPIDRRWFIPFLLISRDSRRQVSEVTKYRVRDRLPFSLFSPLPSKPFAFSFERSLNFFGKRPW